MSVALLPAFVVVALLLAAAGVAKLVSPHAAQAALSVTGIRLPRPAVRLIGVAEIGLAAAALVMPGTVTAAAVAAAYGVFTAFTVRLLRVSAGGVGVDCGCFGGTGAEASALHVALNAVACLICGLATASPPKTSLIFSQPPLTAAAIWIGLAAATYAAYLAFTLVPRSWREYGSEAGP